MTRRRREGRPPPPGDPAGQREAAAYVADLAADLARIAHDNGLGTLGYLLDMARLEARNAAGGVE